MANVKITDLSAGTTLIGTELFEAVQTASSVKLTASQIKAYVLDNSYAHFVDLTDQTAAANTPTPIKFNTSVLSNNITVTNNGSGNPTRLTFAEEGLFNLSINIQFGNSGVSDHAVLMWLRKNGNDIAYSCSTDSIPKATDGGVIILEVNVLEEVAAGDYIEYIWATPSTDVTLQYTAGGSSPYVFPATPSAIFIATQVN